MEIGNIYIVNLYRIVFIMFDIYWFLYKMIGIVRVEVVVIFKRLVIVVFIKS